MPFLNHDHKPTIQHPSGHPVAVIAAFNTLGDLIPRYFSVEDDNHELFKYKIDCVKSTKDKLMVKIFYCGYFAYGYQNIIALCFDVTNHIWVIG